MDSDREVREQKGFNLAEEFLEDDILYRYNNPSYWDYSALKDMLSDEGFTSLEIDAIVKRCERDII